MKRFLIPAMILVSRRTAEEALDFASDAALSVNHETRADGPKLYLCEASDTSEAADEYPGGCTLAGLTCDYAEVLRLRAALQRVIAHGAYTADPEAALELAVSEAREALK